MADYLWKLCNLKWLFEVERTDKLVPRNVPEQRDMPWSNEARLFGDLIFLRPNSLRRTLLSKLSQDLRKPLYWQHYFYIN